jgi:hypothetical protein
VFKTATWEMSTRFEAHTVDAADLAWQPGGGTAICVWDSPLQYRACLYQADGKNLGHCALGMLPHGLVVSVGVDQLGRGEGTLCSIL